MGIQIDDSILTCQFASAFPHLEQAEVDYQVFQLYQAAMGYLKHRLTRERRRHNFSFQLQVTRGEENGQTTNRCAIMQDGNDNTAIASIRIPLPELDAPYFQGEMV